MTLRELIKESNYKTLFNEIYRHFLQKKGYSKSEIIEQDLSYSKVFKELSSLPLKPNYNEKIYIASVGDSDIDVCLLNELEDELFSLDFMPWDDIIDMEIFKTAKISPHHCLACIIYEITFWGFSQEQIAKERKKLDDRRDER